MNIDLNGKRAIVTGSTAGIGFAIATGLAASGATVVVNGRSEKSTGAARQRRGWARGAGAMTGEVMSPDSAPRQLMRLATEQVSLWHDPDLYPHN